MCFIGRLGSKIIGDLAKTGFQKNPSGCVRTPLFKKTHVLLIGCDGTRVFSGSAQPNGLFSIYTPHHGLGTGFFWRQFLLRTERNFGA
jgi:hypothetical protein